MATSRSTRFAARRPGLLGLRHLDAFANGPRSAMGDFMIFLAKRDVFYQEDDFADSTMVAARWTTNAGTGGTAFAYNAGIGGRVQGATGTNGTASNRVVNLYGNVCVSGDTAGGMAARLQVGAAVTDIEWGVGLIDTHTTLTTPVVLVGDIDDASSLASGMGDAALVYMDTAETLKTASLVTLGSTPYAAASTAIGTFAPTAATYFDVTVQLDGDNVYARLSNADGSSVVEATKALGIEGGTSLRPFVVISGVTATTKTWTIDRIAYWCMRPTA